jgi:hypothetical protein
MKIPEKNNRPEEEEDGEGGKPIKLYQASRI